METIIMNNESNAIKNNSPNAELNPGDKDQLMNSAFGIAEELLQFGTWTWTARTNQFEWSEGMYLLMGYESGYAKFTQSNHPLQVSVEDIQRSGLQEVFNRAVNGKKVIEFQHPLITREGLNRIASTRGKLEWNDKGELTRIVGVSRDITEQSRFNKDLLDYKQTMMEMEKFLSSGSWEVNIQGDEQVITWSSGKFELFGYDSADADRLPVTNKELYDRHVSQADLPRLNTILKREIYETDDFTWEYEITTVQGDKKILESYARIVKDAFGKPYKIIGATRDKTKIREYEESLKMKIQELDRSNKELEEFAYIASHDLQEPLRKITAFSERLKDRAKNELGQESHLYLDRMMVGTANMRMLIDNLLEFSRTRRNNHLFESCDLNEILKNTEADLELKIEETGTIFQSARLPVLEAIPSQMQQLFNNILVNAIKFRKPDTPPVVRISCDILSDIEKQLLRLPSAQTYFRIKIRDNGIGFEQEYANKIFQIFQRLHGKSEYPGSGIGLAICKKIAENHHGMIQAESQPGQGATFIIILPETQP